jgi:hypothetical protein
MANVRKCEQCGAVFEPWPEHDRFCSSACRGAWNHENIGGRYNHASPALGWFVTGMSSTTQRLAEVRAADLPQALAVISDAVGHHHGGHHGPLHHDAYDRALEALAPAERRVDEETFAGDRAGTAGPAAVAVTCTSSVCRRRLAVSDWYQAEVDPSPSTTPCTWVDTGTPCPPVVRNSPTTLLTVSGSGAPL